jgi:hypothetical protein
VPGKPVAERPPEGLDAHFLGVWRHALKTLQAQGTWKWEQAPLLAEYVYALKAAQDARVGFGWLERLEEGATEWLDVKALERIAAGLPNQWDRHVKRAAALADQLALTDRGRKAVGIGGNEEDDAPADPFAALDGRDELAKRRRAR